MFEPLSCTVLLTGDDPERKRQEIRQYFITTFERYESLFETLSRPEAYFEKAISLRHPLIFYLGHTATFFINKLLLAGLITQHICPQFESQFAVGVDEMSWDDLDDHHYDWPAVAEVQAYRQKVRSQVLHVIDTLKLELPITWENPWWIILMGIEHERIHLETSSVLIRQHRLEYVQSHADWPYCQETGVAPVQEWVPIPGGKVMLGKREQDATYGWDNEYGQKSVTVQPFQASRYLVSNQEFLEFVEANGYLQPTYWSEEGWQWCEYAQARHPTFWRYSVSEWRLRLMTKEIAMPWDWPVEVNCHEAMAFCNFKSTISKLPIRLPSEAEWQHLVNHAGLSDLYTQPEMRANIQLADEASPCPVHRHAHGPLFDVIGNVWQWTETAIYPYPGFTPHTLYDDFSVPTFDGRHNLMKGGSWISCGNEALLSARYAFRRHFFQHAGFRYIASEASTETESALSLYETEHMLSEYAEFHYGDEYFGVANFPKTIAQLALAAMQDKPKKHALDLGCAVGRATFELATQFQQVTGLDFSARFISLGVQLAEHGMVRYAIATEGELLQYRECHASTLHLDKLPGKVHFIQGDACNLKPHLTGFDLILAVNLIDRLYDPKKLLTTIHQRLKPGGVLLLASPYTWLVEHTPRENWLGGFKQHSENVNTLTVLKNLLQVHFRLMAPPQDVPFVLRETQRKYQHTLSQVTLWERVR